MEEKKAPIKVLVIGAGIIGLTATYHLLKENNKENHDEKSSSSSNLPNAWYYDVTILSKHDPLKTNSSVAPALSRPYAAEPKVKIDAWTKTSYAAFFEIYYDYLKEKAKKNNNLTPDDFPGISFVIDVEYFAKNTFKPAWIFQANDMLDEKIALLEENKRSPIGYVCEAATTLLAQLTRQKAALSAKMNEAKGKYLSRPVVYASVVPIIDSSFYIPWLVREYEKMSKKKIIIDPVGIKSLEAKSPDLERLAKEYDIIINCAGEQARYLTADAQTTPVRGLAVVTKIPEKLDYCIGVEPNPNLDNGEIKIVYAIIRPDSQTCVIGGTFEEVGEAIFSAPEEQQKKVDEIFKAVISLIPGVANKEDFEILEIKEGFRCIRKTVYSEMKEVEVNGKRLLMGGAFGHGGCAYTVSHGVGKEMAQLCNDAWRLLQDKTMCKDERTHVKNMRSFS